MLMFAGYFICFIIVALLIIYWQSFLDDSFSRDKTGTTPVPAYTHREPERAMSPDFIYHDYINLSIPWSPGNMERITSSIMTVLSLVHTAGGSSNFCIFSVGEAYIQVAASNGSPNLICEAVSNSHVKYRKLLPEDITALRKSGFSVSDDPTDYYFMDYDVSMSGEKKLAQLVTGMFADVYHAELDETIKIECVFLQ